MNSLPNFDNWKLASPPDYSPPCGRCLHDVSMHEPTTYCQNEDCLSSIRGVVAVCPVCLGTELEVDPVLMCMEQGCSCDQYDDGPPEPPDRWKERKEWEAGW